MYGNGWPGSTASGVRTGKIWRWKTSTRWTRSWSSSEDQSEKRTPASASSGTIWSRKMRVLAAHELLDPRPDHLQLLARAQAVDRPGAHPGGHLILQRGHPHLVELVEELGEDGHELGPLEQRDAVVLGQVEQAGAEVEARLLAVGEPLVPEGLDLLKRRWRRSLEGVGRGRHQRGIGSHGVTTPSYLAPLRFAECHHRAVTHGFRAM